MPSTTTIIAEPQQLMPAYNPIKYIIDNSNKNEPGFRYIFTIYAAACSSMIEENTTFVTSWNAYITAL